MTCKQCKWWQGSSTLGRCRKYHPRIGQPNMYEDEFCGEFEKKGDDNEQVKKES